MSTSQPSDTTTLAEHAQRHATARDAFYAGIDDAVAAAHAELEQDRLRAGEANPQLFEDHVRPEQAATDSVEPAA